MFPTIPIGPMRLQTYGLFLLIAFWAGLWLAARLADRHGIERDHVYNAGFYALIGGLIAARLGHVIAYFEVYRNDPLQIISLSPGALLPAAGIIGALLVAAIYLRRHHLPPLAFLDVAAMGLLLALAIAGLGAFLAGRTLGTMTDLPWGVELYGVTRHPVALYEALATLALLIVLLRYDRGHLQQPGQLALLALFGYATIRLFLEPLRADSLTVGDGWRLVQLVALLLVAISGGILARMASTESPSAVQESVSP
ncbi:MAG: prolipoprotein diacylglyceryl transferase family protein [Chloroflexota bacterium]|nr:prolipoprotein diacylglyceryl transferase family protein [Chloroflexota bacterium]